MTLLRWGVLFLSWGDFPRSTMDGTTGHSHLTRRLALPSFSSTILDSRDGLACTSPQDPSWSSGQRSSLPTHRSIDRGFIVDRSPVTKWTPRYSKDDSHCIQTCILSRSSLQTGQSRLRRTEGCLLCTHRSHRVDTYNDNRWYHTCTGGTHLIGDPVNTHGLHTTRSTELDPLIHNTKMSRWFLSFGPHIVCIVVL